MNELDEEAHQRIEEIKARLLELLEAINKADEYDDLYLDPDCYYWSPKEELDYALVRLTEQPLAHMKPDGDISELSLFDLIRRGQHRGCLLYVPKKITNLQRINIVQFPEKHFIIRPTTWSVDRAHGFASLFRSAADCSGHAGPGGGGRRPARLV